MLCSSVYSSIRAIHEASLLERGYLREQQRIYGGMLGFAWINGDEEKIAGSQLALRIYR